MEEHEQKGLRALLAAALLGVRDPGDLAEQRPDPSSLGTTCGGWTCVSRNSVQKEVYLRRQIERVKQLCFGGTEATD